jgi:hypothetical protein
MITCVNTSHNPSLYNILNIMNDGKDNILGWDDKISGQIIFDFKKKY